MRVRERGSQRGPAPTGSPPARPPAPPPAPPPALPGEGLGSDLLLVAAHLVPGRLEDAALVGGQHGCGGEARRDSWAGWRAGARRFATGSPGGQGAFYGRCCKPPRPLLSDRHGAASPGRRPRTGLSLRGLSRSTCPSAPVASDKAAHPPSSSGGKCSLTKERRPGFTPPAAAAAAAKHCGPQQKASPFPKPPTLPRKCWQPQHTSPSLSRGAVLWP